jgi:hypothetical protein
MDDLLPLDRYTAAIGTPKFKQLNIWHFDENYKSDRGNWVQNNEKYQINNMDCRVKHTNMASTNMRYNSITHIASLGHFSNNIFYSPEDHSMQQSEDFDSDEAFNTPEESSSHDSQT